MRMPNDDDYARRLMFGEWGYNDWGAGWVQTPSHVEGHVRIINDIKLNIIVIFDDTEKCDGWEYTSYNYESTVFYRDMSCEEKINNTQNVLIWIGKDCKRRFVIRPGVAEVYENELRGRSEDDLQKAEGSMLDVLLLVYRGYDKKVLEQMIKECEKK